MKISILDIPKEGLRLHWEEGEETLNRALRQDKRGIKVLRPMDCHLFIQRKATKVSVDGYIEAEVSFVCSLCLRRFNRSVHWDIHYTLVPEERFVEERERELSREELDTAFFTGDTIDTTEIIKEQFFLEMPIRFLCKEDCRGLCPRCGTDLNEGECACPKDRPVDPRLAKLRELKIKSS